MCLVHDEEIPAHRFQGAEHLRPFDEVDGRQVDARNRPGVHVRGQFASDRSQPRGVRVDRRQIQQRGQLLLPLRPQRGRHDHQDSGRCPPSHHLPHDHPCLHRLPQAHVVSDQHPRGGVAEDREGGLELVGEQLDRARTESKRAEREGPAEPRADVFGPEAWGQDDEAWYGSPAWSIERQHQRPQHRRPLDAGEIERRAVDVSRALHDAPVGAADGQVIARVPSHALR